MSEHKYGRSMERPSWRDDLDEDEQRLIEYAESAVMNWHDGDLDCWRWLKLIASLVEMLDAREVAA